MQSDVNMCGGPVGEIIKKTSYMQEPIVGTQLPSSAHLTLFEKITVSD